MERVILNDVVMVFLARSVIQILKHDLLHDSLNKRSNKRLFKRTNKLTELK
jgi:hypothetical protein